MHEAGGTELPAVLSAIIIAVIVSLGIRHFFSATKFDIRKLQMLAVNKTTPYPSTKALASRMAVDHGNSSCAVCSAQTTLRCSRCKAVNYCTKECQQQHWGQGHKVECLKLKESPQNGSSRSIITESENSSGFLKRGYLHQEIKLGVAASQDQGYATCNGNTSRHINKVVFPYDNFLKIFNWDKLQLPPCGLINRGNSCFANVVLQCLTCTRPLAAYLLQGGHSQQCRRNDWCFMCELQNHISRVRESQGPFSPLGILSHIPTIGNHLGFGRQEDAHEFMRFAIDSMQSICLDEAGGEKALHPSSQETTLIHHIFGGHLQSQVKCMECEHESDRYENMMDLAVEIHGNVESLEDALTQFTTPEWLDGENKYKCDRCNSYVKARKRLTLHQAPNVLTIALKRFRSGKFGKLNKQVTFPEVLNISPYMSGKGDNPPQYQLYAVVVHVDMLNASFFGHYVCYVKDFHGMWYKVDDSKVKEVDLNKVMEQRAYMLLYTRCSPRPAPITMKGTVEMAANANNGLSVNSAVTQESERGMDSLLSAERNMLGSGFTEYMQSRQRSSPIVTNGSIEMAANADSGFSVNSLAGLQSKDGSDSLVSDNEHISLDSVPSQSSQQDDDSTFVNLQFSCLDLQSNSDLLRDDVAGWQSNGVESVATCEEPVKLDNVQNAGQQFIGMKSNSAPSFLTTGDRTKVQGGHVEELGWPTEKLTQATKGSFVGENGWIEQGESDAILNFPPSSLQDPLFVAKGDRKRVVESISDDVEGVALLRENVLTTFESKELLQALKASFVAENVEIERIKSCAILDIPPSSLQGSPFVAKSDIRVQEAIADNAKGLGMLENRFCASKSEALMQATKGSFVVENVGMEQIESSLQGFPFVAKSDRMVQEGIASNAKGIGMLENGFCASKSSLQGFPFVAKSDRMVQEGIASNAKGIGMLENGFCASKSEALMQATKGSFVVENVGMEESCAISDFSSSSLQGSLFVSIDDRNRVPQGVSDEVKGIELIRENGFCASKPEEPMRESTDGNSSCENPLGSSMWGYAREESGESIKMKNIPNKTPTSNSSIEELKNGSENADLAQTCTSRTTKSTSNREETGKGTLETSSKPLFKPGFLNPKRGTVRSKEASNGCEGSHESNIRAHTQVTCIPTGDTNLAKETRLGNPSNAERPKPKPARAIPTNNTLKSNSLNNNETKMKIGRNDSCTCGSQQKFKKCCGKADVMGRQLVV